MKEEGKSGICSKAAKGAPCKGKSAGRRKKVEEDRRRKDSVHSQAIRSIARIKKELSRKAEKKSGGAL